MEREVSHNDIYRELGELKGLMSSIVLRGQKDDEDKKDIFGRINRLETRMAQVLLMAVLAGMILPPLTSFLGQHLHFSLRTSSESLK